MFKVKAEGMGRVNQTKKGGFIRKFLVNLPDGKKDVITVYAQESGPLDFSGVCEICVRNDFFFAVE